MVLPAGQAKARIGNHDRLCHKPPHPVLVDLPSEQTELMAVSRAFFGLASPNHRPSGKWTSCMFFDRLKKGFEYWDAIFNVPSTALV